MKRHLKGHGFTPDEYRARFGLPKTYPMVAPAYSASRRAIAEKLGLGRRVKGPQAEAAPPAESKMEETAAPKPQAQTAKARKTATPKSAKSIVLKADVTTPAKAKATPKAKAPAKVENAVAEPKPVETPASAGPGQARAESPQGTGCRSEGGSQARPTQRRG